ncbi:uncharacterized protein LOC141587544 [Silene latifolia]|uniref:uncharacterized protein LOC141587544 n=1 Tax=Silene latifolia TaxID=37657 RepID=UPI003D77DFF7
MAGSKSQQQTAKKSKRKSSEGDKDSPFLELREITNTHGRRETTTQQRKSKAPLYGNTSSDLENIRPTQKTTSMSSNTHSQLSSHISIDQFNINMFSTLIYQDLEGYDDIGDPIYTCTKCGAQMWYGERDRMDTKPVIIQRNRGRGPYTFRIGGENTHLIGSLLPNNDAPPKFCQLYIYDTEEELKHRKNALSSTNGIQFDDGLMKDLKEMVDRYNVLAKSFRMARDRLHQGADGEVRLRLMRSRNTDGRTYNLPTVSEVAALIVGDMENTVDSRDIVVEERSGRLQRILELHASYLALQYPILFPRGEDGHRLGIPHSQHSISSSSSNENARDKLTLREWFAFRIQDRSSTKEFPTILMAGKLFQQFVADGCTMIESDRLKYICFNQPKLRSENFKNIENAAAIGQTNPSSAGVVWDCGYPDLFITFTCNPKWPEITSEFQKRGLPHAHILLFLQRDDKFPEAVDVDRVISAEIPDPLENPALYAKLKDCMIHGPCGELNQDAPCMIDGICSKKFPKRFNERTTVDGDGYPVYKRRENGTTIEKNGKTIHNRYVVPYNADLLLKYRAHINVEWCNQARSIKYLFK